MIPRRRVVAGPGEAVTLAPGKGGAGQNEWPLIGPELQQALESCSGILQAEDVVNLRMRRCTGCKSGLFDAMHGIERHCFARTVKDCRLIHVVPESGDAISHEIRIEAAPPFAGLRTREVRKH